jgi:hypothetical protein
MERFIIKEPHISPTDNKKIGILVLYVINVVYHISILYCYIYVFVLLVFYLIRLSFRCFTQGPSKNLGRP